MVSTISESRARAGSAAATTWMIDPAESRVEFSIGKRLVLFRLTVNGRFADVGGTVTLDEREPINSRVEAIVGVASVDTGNAKRDRHLLAADFLDAERYPTLRFAGDRVESLDVVQGRGRLRGELTFRGVTRDVTLGLAFDPTQLGEGSERLHVTASTEINRRDFGLTWSNPVIGLTNAVTINLEIVARRA
jgi:polyisoprenoid-binding protein YceI